MSPPKPKNDYEVEHSSRPNPINDDFENGYPNLAPHMATGHSKPAIINVDQYGQPIKEKNASEEYWAGRAPLRPPSLAKLPELIP